MANEPLLLLIDTSGRTGRVGLALGPTLLDRAELDPGRGHARDLTRVIRDLLTRGGKTPANLAAIGLNIGPGSFTGIRVGLATAKAMAFALGVKIIGSDVFDLIAARFAAQHPALYVVVDFQLNSLLSVDFQIDGEGKVVRGPVQMASQEEIPKLIKPDAPFAGPALAKLANRFDGVEIIGEPPHEPRLEELHELTLKRFYAGRFDDEFAVEPFYARPSSAEVTWDARAKFSG